MDGDWLDEFAAIINRMINRATALNTPAAKKPFVECCAIGCCGGIGVLVPPGGGGLDWVVTFLKRATISWFEGFELPPGPEGTEKDL